MAKDKVKICIGKEVRIDYLKNSLNQWQYVNSKDSQYWFYKIGDYYIHYSLIPGSNHIGYLTIDFSISKLLNGDNALPATQVDANKIKERIYSDLGTVLNFKSNNILDFKKWTICRDETFIDIIASKEVVESLFYLIEHSNIPRRKVDTTYKDKGTIYIYSGNSKDTASWILIAYDKVKEGKSRNVDITKIKGLKQGQSCLRVELKTKGYSLKKLIKDFKENNNVVSNLTDVRDNYSKSKNYFTDILDTDTQYYSLNKVLKELNLFNIKILSEKELFKLIRKRDVFKSKTKKNNAKEVVQFLNGDIDEEPYCSKILNQYKNDFLNAGVHYLYVKHPIPEISQAMLDKALCETGNLIIA